MMRHKYKCNNWCQLSADVLFNEILIHTRYFNLVRKLAKSKNYKKLYKDNFPKCRSSVKIKKEESLVLHIDYPPIEYSGFDCVNKFMLYKNKTITTIFWLSYRKKEYYHYIYYMIETDKIIDNIYEKIIDRIYEIDKNNLFIN